MFYTVKMRWVNWSFEGLLLETILRTMPNYEMLGKLSWELGIFFEEVNPLDANVPWKSKLVITLMVLIELNRPSIILK